MIQYSRVHDCVSYRCHSSSATQPIESGNFRHFSARYACVALHDFYFTHMSSAMRCVCDASCHWQNGTFEHWGIRPIIILLILSITFLCNFQERRRRQQQRWMWMNIKHLLTIRVFLAIPFLLLFIFFFASRHSIQRLSRPLTLDTFAWNEIIRNLLWSYIWSDGWFQFSIWN